MSVLTFSNPYALLDDDTPAPVVAKKVAAPVPVAKAAAAPVKTNTRAPRKVYQEREVTTDGPIAGESAKEDRSNGFAGRGGSRGGRGAGRGGRGGANPRSNGGTYLGGDKPRRENGGGRVFDKHSQTGHKDSDKSEAQGWGAEEGKKELEAEVLGEADAKTESTPAVDGEASESKAEKVYPVQEEEEEDNTQTYDEYLASISGVKKLEMALPEVRIANEGVDESQWAGQTVAAKKGANEDEWFTGSVKTEAKAKKVKEGKTFLEINTRYPPPKRDGPPRGGSEGGRGRGGRGGRGEGRGGRGGNRGAPRGAPRSAAPAMDLSSATAFPTLA